MITTVMIAPQLFDRKLLIDRRRRAIRLGAETFLLDRVSNELVERLALVKRHFPLALDLGTPGDGLTSVLKASKQVDQIIICEPLAQLRAPDMGRVIGDEEALPFGEEKFNLIVSALSLQAVNDLPGALLQIRRSLKPDGLMLAAMVGGDTLTELRESITIAESEIRGGAGLRVVPFADIRALGSLLQRAGFALPVVDLDRLTLNYADLIRLGRDLTRMGATNTLTERSRKPLTRSILSRAMEIYAERFASESKRGIRATVDILWLSGWAPHKSQQKPLKPGSAKVRLADALGTIERPAGEKTER